jgi:hypothetical protein
LLEKVLVLLVHIQKKHNYYPVYLVINHVPFPCHAADSVHLGFLPREVAKWVSPLCDLGFFKFSGFIYPREALEAAYGASITKVQLILYVSKVAFIYLRFNCEACACPCSSYSINEIQGPEFSRVSEVILDDHFPALCSLVASLDRSLGLWRLEEVCNSTGIVLCQFGP